MTYLPPRAYCERSFERCDSTVDAGHKGTIEAATIVSAAFENLPPPPYAIAYVRLDGVSTAMLNFVHGIDLSDVPAAAQRLQPGTRVRVAFVAPNGRPRRQPREWMAAFQTITIAPATTAPEGQEPA
mgnify:CR=1 FL=1